MKKKIVYFVGIGLLLGTFYWVGPKVNFEEPILLDNTVDIPIDKLENYIKTKESKISNLKPNNEAKIIWYDTLSKSKTTYVLLYLHGFSASHMEGYPVHIDFAQRYGMNCYLARLEDHGRDDNNSLKGLTPDSFLESAEEAFNIAKKLGDKVIVMACSSGATLALPLIAAGEKAEALILYSPNMGINHPASGIALQPWGKQLVKLVLKGEYNHISYPLEATKYWNSTYHMDGPLALQKVIETYMNELTYKKISCPIFMGYYYKSKKEQDDVVLVSKMLEFFEKVSTPNDKKVKVSFPDAGHHVICSPIFSHSIEEVKKETFDFAEKTLGLVQVPLK